jgi:hypothetical protein
MRKPVLSVVVLAFMSIGVGCVVHKHEAPPAAAAPAATAPTAPAATTTAPPATTAPPVAEDPNADIPADAEDPAPVATPLPPQGGAVETPTGTPGLAEQLPPGVADGKPAGVEPGAPAGFWIWRNAAGVYKLRTTTAKKLHTFRGRVKGVQAPIGKVKPSRTELGDRITRGSGGEVIFGFTTNGHVDGFDFRAPKCVRFDLTTNHFIVCPK